MVVKFQQENYHKFPFDGH